MSDLAKQQSLERLAPILVQLGADPALILEEMVRVFQLPENLSTPAPPPPEVAPPAPEGLPPEGLPIEGAPGPVPGV